MEIKDLFNLENDKFFQQLDQQVNSFNTLKILRLESYEIRHSNILYWLLNPRENHNLDDYFLRKLLEQIILIDENFDNCNYELIEETLNNSLIESHVFREVQTNNNRFIDLVLINEQLKTVILIENKFYSTELKNQLDDYLDFIKEEFENYKIIPIYLTLKGDEPSNSEYFTLTYENIETILDIILMLFKERLSLDVYQFIEDYNQILKEKFYPNEEQILQAIDIYRNHKIIIEELFEESSVIKNPLQIELGYRFEFMIKYKNTIDYIFKHGKNILSYSFEQFINEQFDKEVLYKAHSTLPYLLPPEWIKISERRLLEKNYWLGKGLVVWFEQTNDMRLRLVVELGPIEYKERISFIENLGKLGISFNDNSKQERARYTRFFSEKIDINKWDDMDEVSKAIKELYNGDKFTLLKKQVSSVLNNEICIQEKDHETTNKLDPINANVEIHKVFKKWMKSKDISEDNYRSSSTSKNLSFKIPLFDKFKEKLGETRIRWWWDNGPFLFWFEIKPESLYFTLEIGPIAPENRVMLMESIKEKGISFRKRGLNLEAKYTRVHSETISTKNLKESELLEVFNTLYDNEELQDILKKLEIIYEETIVNFEL